MMNTVLAAIAAGSPETALERVLLAIRDVIPADGVVALRRVDAVTAIMLASSPVDILPGGITYAGPFADAIGSGR